MNAEIVRTMMRLGFTGVLFLSCTAGVEGGVGGALNTVTSLSSSVSVLTKPHVDQDNLKAPLLLVTPISVPFLGMSMRYFVSEYNKITLLFFLEPPLIFLRAPRMMDFVDFCSSSFFFRSASILFLSNVF